MTRSRRRGRAAKLFTLGLIPAPRRACARQCVAPTSWSRAQSMRALVASQSRARVGARSASRWQYCPGSIGSIARGRAEGIVPRSTPRDHRRAKAILRHPAITVARPNNARELEPAPTPTPSIIIAECAPHFRSGHSRSPSPSSLGYPLKRPRRRQRPRVSLSKPPDLSTPNPPPSSPTPWSSSKAT